MKLRLFALLFGSVLSCSVHAAGNSLNPILDDKFAFKLGATWLKADGTFSSTKDGEPTDKISTGDLGIDDSETNLYFGARWRFTERWRLTLTTSDWIPRVRSKRISMSWTLETSMPRVFWPSIRVYRQTFMSSRPVIPF